MWCCYETRLESHTRQPETALPTALQVEALVRDQDRVRKNLLIDCTWKVLRITAGKPISPH
jgi:hypothetical protein